MSTVAAPPRSPFKGLAAFEDTDVDALLFFGRERERAVVVANLLASRLTVLYGESGVGKSSLLAAAVVRDLRAAGDAPIVLRTTWSGAHEPLDAAFEEGGDGYLVLDQFEESFLYQDDTHALLHELPDLLATTRVNVLISLREDALARLDAFKAAIPGVFGNQVRLEHLDPDQARAAILGPLERWRELYDEQVDAEPAFVDAVIRDVGGARVEAPYLQLVLERVWEAERAAGSSLLRRETLEGLGGAAAVVRDQFRGALDGLPPDEQDVASAVFAHLVTPSGTKIALGAADLAEYAHVPADDVRRVLDRLTHDRVVRPVEGSDRYEIFHDVLAEPVTAWRVERQLVSERAAARRQQRRLLTVVGAALVALAVVAGLAVWAFSERGSARSQARHSQARELDARALQQLPFNANQSVRLALTSIWLWPTPSADVVLRQALVADRLRLVRHVGAAVRDAAVSPRGDLIAVALPGRRIQLLAASNRRLVRTIVSPRHVASVAFVDAGRILLAATVTGRPDAFDVGTGRRLQLPRGVAAARTPEHGLRLVRVRPAFAHARTIVSVGDVVVARVRGADGRVRAQLYRRSKLVRILPQIGIADVALSSDGRRVATAGQDGFTNVWDTRTGKLVWHLADAKSGVDAVSFSPRGTLLASGSEDGGVRIWDMRKGTRTFLLSGHTSPVAQLAWSPDGSVVASSGVDGTVLLWRMRGLAGAGELAATLAGSEGSVGVLAFTPDGARLVTGGVDGILRIWDATPDQQLTIVGRAPGPALAAHWTKSGPVGLWPHVVQSKARRLTSRAALTALGASPDSDVVGIGAANGTTVAWDARAGRVLARQRGRASIGAVAVHGETVAAGAADGTVSVLRRWSSRQRGAVDAAAFSADGRLLATAGPGGATLWDVSTGRRLHVFLSPLGASAVAFSPDGRLLAVAGRDGTGRLWFTATGRPYRVLHADTKALTDIVFSADGRVVATSGTDADGRIWNVAKGTHFVLQRRAFGPLAAISLDPTGDWVAGAAPVSVIVWNASSGRQLFYVRGHTAVLTSIAFAPNRETILTSSRDGTIRTYTCEVCADRAALIHLAKVRLAQTR